METNEDQELAFCALANFEEANIFLTTAKVDGWHSSAAQAAEDKRISYLVALADITDQVRELVRLLNERDELRRLVLGAA